MPLTWNRTICAGILAFAGRLTPLQAAPPVTFTYQGQLKEAGLPVNGLIDLNVTLTDVDGQKLESVDFPAVGVVNGLFTVDLAFSSSHFQGDPLFLLIAVRNPHDPTDTAPFLKLSPLQPINAAPFALFSFDTANRHSLDASDGSPTNAVFVDADGDVGVGTTTPEADLHVRGKTPLGRVIVTPSIADSSAEILITENTSASLGAMMRYDGPTNQWQVLGLARDAQNLPIENGPHLVVGRDNGRVGIGTVSPGSALHVAGDVRADGPRGFETHNPNNLSAQALFSWNVDIARVRVGGGGEGAANGFDIQTTSDRSLMRLLHNGNVGISAPAPETELDVRDLSNTDAGRIRAANANADTWVQFWSGHSDGANDPAIIWSDGTAGDDLRLGVGDTDGGPFTERLRVTGAGNVGIGTTAPTTRLHVVGEIRSTAGFRFPDNTLQTTAQLVGPAGPPGPAGPRGPAGLDCWDTDGDGNQDGVEDRNGDGSFDADDCQGPSGAPATTFAVCGANTNSCDSACGGSQFVLADLSENGSGTPGAGCSAVADGGSCTSESDLSDTCCVCRVP